MHVLAKLMHSMPRSSGWGFQECEASRAGAAADDALMDTLCSDFREWKADGQLHKQHGARDQLWFFQIFLENQEFTVFILRLVP